MLAMNSTWCTVLGMRLLSASGQTLQLAECDQQVCRAKMAICCANHLLLASVPVNICISACAVALLLQQPTAKVELLCEFLIQVIMCIIILKQCTLQAAHALI